MREPVEVPAGFASLTRPASTRVFEPLPPIHFIFNRSKLDGGKKKTQGLSTRFDNGMHVRLLLIVFAVGVGLSTAPFIWYERDGLLVGGGEELEPAGVIELSATEGSVLSLTPAPEPTVTESFDQVAIFTQKGKSVQDAAYIVLYNTGQRNTQWAWQPDSKTCPFTKMTAAALCSTMQSFGLSRLMMVGDSLTALMFKSLENSLLKNVCGQEEYHTEFFVKCPDGPTLELVFIRNDFLSTQPWGCFAATPMPWVYEYLSSMAPTLLVLNTGLHFHNLTYYKQHFDHIVQRINSSAFQVRTQDIVAYRTSVPGHTSCSQNTKPYNWNAVKDFNTYTKQILADTKVLVLDVFPITPLRPDGHKNPPKDCLHYSLPGPPDWWNHLLITQLARASLYLPHGPNSMSHLGPRRKALQPAAGIRLYEKATMLRITAELHNKIEEWAAAGGMDKAEGFRRGGFGDDSPCPHHLGQSRYPEPYFEGPTRPV
jgi:hypothetical protein